MHFVLHVSTDRFPSADSLGLAVGFKLQDVFLTGVWMKKSNPKTILALDAVFGESLCFCNPSDQLFPRNEDWGSPSFWHKTNFPALAVEAGRNYGF
ncbi:hypothetical protein [uncultured Marinobacter sp.]|uniref:hypothetical protein n=1 Tax=uncultured Marinobacter sp. TaxID=187379 RepID=UPI0026030154|nr:hypothetical protein [uncultured Marinobacter sp.]